MQTDFIGANTYNVINILLPRSIYIVCKFITPFMWNGKRDNQESARVFFHYRYRISKCE